MPRHDAVYSRSMDARVRSALVVVTELFQESGIDFQVGGSALLHALGLVERVGDLDLVFRSEDRTRLGDVLRQATGRSPAFDVRQEPGFVSTWRAAHRFRDVDLDMTGGIALEYPGGFVARLPHAEGSSWHIDGVTVPLAPLADWLLVYRHHKPGRAALLEPLVPAAEWDALLAAIEAPPGFDGSLPVAGG
jgi:hypothetical protein